MVEMHPTEFKQANERAESKELTPAQKVADITKEGHFKPMPVFVDGVRRITIWKCTSIWGRIIFLFTGKVNIMEFGGITPKSLTIGNLFKYKSDAGE